MSMMSVPVLYCIQAMKLLQERGAKNVVLSSGELGREKDVMIAMGRSEGG